MNTYGRENQDLFVLSVLGKKTGGTYVEIGGANAIMDNNTYLLESQFNWRGFSVEWYQPCAETFRSRKNPCICADATILDYSILFEKYNLGNHIDYLQLDIDPPSNTFLALKQINFEKFSFSVITYEHDAYAGGNFEREESRKILESYGYTRVISDVSHKGLHFEDWYVNEKYMPNDNWKEFIGEKIELAANFTDEKYVGLFNKFLS